jgi:hypothetical protein
MGGNTNQDVQRGLGGAQIVAGTVATATGNPEIGVPLMMNGIKGVSSPNPNQGPLTSSLGALTSSAGAAAGGGGLGGSGTSGAPGSSGISPAAMTSGLNALAAPAASAPKPPAPPAPPMRPMASAPAPAPSPQKPVVQSVPSAGGQSNPAIMQYLQMLKSQGGVAA